MLTSTQVTTRHHIFKDPIQFLELHAPTSVAHVTKHPPLALLRTCRLVRHEARPYLEAWLIYEPLRYIVDAPCLATLVSNCYNIVTEIARDEDLILRGKEIRFINYAMEGGSRSIFTANTPLLGGVVLDHMPIHRFVIKCARWNIGMRRLSKSLPEQPDNVRIGIRVPAGSTKRILVCYPTYAFITMYFFQQASEPRNVCLVVKRGYEFEEEERADLYEDILQEIDRLRRQEAKDWSEEKRADQTKLNAERLKSEVWRRGWEESA
jgi:hypothetical protein